MPKEGGGIAARSTKREVAPDKIGEDLGSNPIREIEMEMIDAALSFYTQFNCLRGIPHPIINRRRLYRLV